MDLRSFYLLPLRLKMFGEGRVWVEKRVIGAYE